MAYNPGESYNGDRYLAAGMTAAGNNIVAGLDKYWQNKQDSEALDAHGAMLAQMAGPDGQPLMSADTLAKYQGSSLSAKKAIFADTLLAYQHKANAIQADQSQQRLGLERQRVDMEGQRLSMENAQPTPDAIASMAKAGYVSTGLPGNKAFLPDQSKKADRANLVEVPGHPELMVSPMTGQVVHLNTGGTGSPSALPVDGGRVVDLGNGKRVFSADKRSSGDKLDTSDPRVTNINGLLKQKADLMEQMSKAGAKSGDTAKGNWNPFVANTSYQQEFDKIDQQINAYKEDLLKNPPVGVVRQTTMQQPAAAAAPTATPASQPAQTTQAIQTAATVKQLDPPTAQRFLAQSNGDREKARQAARAAGYTF